MNNMPNLENLFAKYFVAFAKVKVIGPIRFQKICNFFGNIEEAWNAKLIDFQSAGIEEKIAQKIIDTRNQINLEAEIEKLESEGIKFVTLMDDNYPKLLKEIYNPPFILFYRGDISCLNNSCLGVVGARKNSSYGQQACEEIVSALARQSITIISGLALGIDAIAHESCLQAEGYTAAVIGSSLDWGNIGPSTNRNLAKKIIEKGGCLLSEYAPVFPASKITFPQRNRIISGLSLGILIIEAAKSSGTLITGKFALEQNRDVFAVPGNIFSSTSEGTNNIIKLGAKLVTNASDILEELNLKQISEIAEDQNSKIIATEEEKLILQYLSREPTHIDKISQLCRIKINVLSSKLMLMEINGLIKDLGAQNYIKIIK
jgi:DNA processing protein